MYTYREFILNCINDNNIIDIWWINELKKYKEDINNSEFETSNHLRFCQIGTLKFNNAVDESANSYIDYLYYNR